MTGKVLTGKVMSPDDVAAQLRSGMTIGIGGWGSRRKPMALVRAILRSALTDLEIVSYGGPDVGLLIAGGHVRRVVCGFVSLDTIPLEPHFRLARQGGTVELTELDEGMLHWGLLAAAHRLPFLPLRAGLGSDVMRVNPQLRMVRSPYGDEELVAMPALRLDAALIHLNRADAAGNGQYLGPDPYFDDLFCLAAERAFASCEQIVPTARLLESGPPQSLLVNRAMVHGVIETPGGAHFTSCVPDYGRDEAFQAYYAAAASDAGDWRRFRDEYLAGDEASYQQAVRRFAESRARASRRRAHDRRPHDRPPHGRRSHDRPPHGRPPHGRPPHGRPPHGRAEPRRGLRGGVRRGLARRRCHPGQPDGPDPHPGRQARATHLRARPADLRRGGLSAGAGGEDRPGHRRLAALPLGLHHGGGRPPPRHDGGRADRPVRQPEHLLHRRLGRPRAQLLGVRGAPGNTINHPTSYWVPRHTRRVFVEQVDMVSGVGYDRAAGLGPQAARFHESVWS